MQRSVKGSFSVTAYEGDFKTLLAFDLDQKETARLAGFTIQAAPRNGSPPYYLLNALQFERPGDHAGNQAATANSSLNAPFQKFRWLHVPGQFHQGMAPFVGPYTYTATPRYFDGSGSMLPLDPARSASVTIDVAPFAKGALALGFTRGFVQSQAYVHHFGPKAVIQPADPKIDFNTGAVAGTSQELGKFTYRQEYEWLGSTARVRIFDLLDAVLHDPNLALDVFAYDLKEPDIIARLLELAQQQRIRVVLDNSSDHHSRDGAKAKLEDDFAAAFAEAAGGEQAPIVRGKFGRYSHDKVLIVKAAGGHAVRVLTGSTNFSVTGLYVNSNHVVIIDDATVAAQYEAVFEEAYTDGCSKPAWLKSELSQRRYRSSGSGVPPLSITFAPHDPAIVQNVLGSVVDRVKEELARTDGSGSVLFAVMDLGTPGQPNMVTDELRSLHEQGAIFTYGISDTQSGIELYKRNVPHGVLVTGKPVHTLLPAPFSQVPNLGGPAAHQVHHKFVVCGFNGPDPTVFCGSSNLAEGGEANNGDNLLEIHDGDVAGCFAIEALALVDHFDFLDKSDTGGRNRPPADTRQAAIDAHWYLAPTDGWARSYYSADDLHERDRMLFAR